MKKGLKFERLFTESGKSPFDQFEWERREVIIKDYNTGSVVFNQKGVEVPKEWSQHATNILAQKYFRKTGVPQPDGSLGGETSLKQVAHRLADCWRVWGEREGYFDAENGQAFYDEIVYMICGQYAAPNSPQWFNTGLYNSYGIEGGVGNNYYAEKVSAENVGVISKLWTYAHSDVFVSKVTNTYERPQTSACFILSVEDDLVGPGGIFDGIKNEAAVFKGGSGAGTNFSNIRAKGEPLSNGGTSSGLKSFLKINDCAAGAIKSGGTTRRAAKMVILDVYHPEIIGFIRWKNDEEKKARILIAAGYDGHYEGEAYGTVSGQNSNNSVSAPDAFFYAVEQDLDWSTTNRTDGAIHTTYKAREIFKEIYEAACASGDPGLQYSDTINEWNTCKADGNIRASNPCVTGDTLVSTDLGDFPIAELVGKTINIYGSDCKLYEVTQVFETGEKEVYELALHGSRTLKLTADHKVLTRDKGDVPASELVYGDAVYVLNKDIKGKGYLAVAFFKSLTYLGVEPVYDLTEPNTHHFFANGIAVHNCSEYLFLDDTACNLASLRLTKFLYNPIIDNRQYYELDDRLFTHACRIWTTVLDITVSISSYPTEKTAMGAYKYRTLGLGYADLGALLMLLGIPYGSKEALAHTEGITRAMNRTAYETSAEIAEILGAFPRYEANKESVNEVLVKHGLSYLVDKPIRNAQVTLLAPTGTIGLIMDCSTTGIEPHYQLTVTKHLAGGGTMTIESQVLRPALKNLGYSDEQIEDIVYYITGYKLIPFSLSSKFKDKKAIDLGLKLEERGLHSFKINTHISNSFNIEGAIKKTYPDLTFESLTELGFTQSEIDYLNAYIYGHGTIEGAPHIKDEHLPVFDCANTSGKGTRFLSYQAHLDMMAAAQPHLSGAISKTVNLPQGTTPEQVGEVYMKAWKMKLKCIALYVDGCKQSQPYQSQKKEKEPVVLTVELSPEIKKAIDGAVSDFVHWGQKKRLPERHKSWTEKARINGHKFFFTVGEYEDGTPGELFIASDKSGADARAHLENFAMLFSECLQYGAPLYKLIEKHKGTHFQPYGFTGNAQIPYASSIVDYIMRTLEQFYINGKPSIKPLEAPLTPLESALFDTPTNFTAAPKKSQNAFPCTACGAPTEPNGKCRICTICGATSGCGA